MKTIINTDTWERKEIYNFFKDFDEPFYGLTANVDCTIAYDFCKEHHISFFLFYLHKSLIAVNKTIPFKLRIVENEVVLFNTINASATINKPNGTFGFSYIEYQQDFYDFDMVAKKEIERVQNSSQLMPAISGENVIHYSSIPWVQFTSLSHARHYAFNDSCPKISFGKIMEDNKRRMMPVSIHVHHALVDGKHVGEYLDTFQELLNKTP